MQKIETEHGIFTENETTGQTAEQVYAEWLENKDKPAKPTEIEVLQAKLNSATQQLEFQEELIVEMAMLLY